jgi:hypothetical protein
MSLQRLFAASILVLSSVAFAADPPPQKSADNPPGVQQQQPQQPQAQPQRPQQPQRGFGRFGFGQFQRDPFQDALNALGDLALTPGFTITNEQKESIQSLKFDQKLAMDKWKGEHADDLQKLQEERQAAIDSGNREKLQDIRQKSESLRKNSPKPEDAVKKLMGLLNEEQRTRLDERMAQRRAEEEQARQ